MSEVLKNMIDFNDLLLEKYKKLGLNESEVTTLMVINKLINDGNDFITADLLSLKMTLSVKDIDNILVNLLNRKFIEYDVSKKKMRTTIKPLMERLLRELSLDLSSEYSLEVKKDASNLFDRIHDKFEEAFGRHLTPLENDKIKEWISCGNSEEVIYACLQEATLENKKTIRNVDKHLVKKGIRSDMVQEGYSTRSEKWQKDIASTIDIAKEEWNK
ncbi:MAG: DnaD domain protein [Bacilli bacterium]